MERSRKYPLHRVVVFDLGEVLASPADLYVRLGSLLASDVETVRSAYWVIRDEHDRGMAACEYWASVALAVGAAPVSESLLDSLSLLDSQLWTTIRPAADANLRRLADAGVDIAVLSNAPRELGVVARQSDWAPYIREWFFSGDLGIAKPDPDIYAVVTAELKITPEQIVFFDDRQANVDAARAAGWDAYLWTSDAMTEQVLASLALV